MAEDSLDASKMNVKPGGKQPKMHDTYWGGTVQKMTFTIGIPKGMKQVLESEGYVRILLLLMTCGRY